MAARTRLLSYVCSMAASIPLVVGLASAPAGAGRAAGGAASSTARDGAIGQPFVPQFGAYLGIDPNFESTGSPSSKAAVVESDIGRNFGIVSFYMSFTDAPPIVGMQQVAARGSIPMVSMHCGPSDAAVAAGTYDSTLQADALAFKAYGHPVLFRWFWEMNLFNTGGHLACLGNLSTAGAEYVAAYQHIWTVFRDEGADNVSFVWAPSAALHAQPAAPFFPGAGYVDWIGADMYDRTGYGPFGQMFASYYDEWSRYGKPLMLSETGAVGSAAQVWWLQSIASSAQTQFPELHAVIYVDATDINDYRLVPGTAGMAELAGMAHSGFFVEPQHGFLYVSSSGGVHNYGTGNYGGPAGHPIPAPIVGMAESPGGNGYWLVGSDGSVYAYGAAHSYGSMRGLHLNRPIVAIAAMPSGDGYWLIASDGGVFTFGAARFHGSTGSIHLNKPIVGAAATADGNGYWFVASDGGVFTFGDAKFRGSTGSMHLNSPIVGMAVDAGGAGYWLVAADGGIFSFGTAPFDGSLGSTHLSAPVVGMAADPTDNDYRLATAAGAVYEFPGGGSYATAVPESPAVGIVTAF